MDSMENNKDCTFFDSDLQEIEHYLQEFDKMKQSMGSSSSVSEANESKTFKDALARLEEEFRYILITYTTSNPLDKESFSDSSFSSSPSHFRLSISSTNVSGDENKGSYAPNGELVSSDNLIATNGDDNSGHNTLSFSLSIINGLLHIGSEAIYYLRCIVERMIASGSAQECVHAYCSIRRPVMDASFLKLGIGTLSIREAQMLGWDGLKKKIKRWIEAVEVCFRVLFANEKMLLDQIFQGLPLDSDINGICFVEIVEGPAKQIFSFVQVVSTVSRRSVERLFLILDLYNALSNLMPDIEMFSQGKYLESIRVQAIETLSKLAEVVRGNLEEFENAVLNEISKFSTLGGNIHPLARYVMNYMIFIASYKQPLTEIIVSKPPAMVSENMNLVEVEMMSPLALHLNWIISILQLKLEEKSKNYDNLSLGHLFMMNNVNYMSQKIRGCSELQVIIEDDDCLRKLTGKTRMTVIKYLRSSWVGVLNCLGHEVLHVKGSSPISKSALREKLKTFNARFEEVRRTQATWLVPDIQLREELGISISGMLIPAYRSFVRRFGSNIESGSRHPENYIKYTAEELESAIFDLFGGDIPKEEIKMTCM